MHTEHETCYHCGSATGKAGQGDGSISDALGNGPYCEKCWRELTDGINATLTARVAALTAERDKLRAALRKTFDWLDSVSRAFEEDESFDSVDGDELTYFVGHFDQSLLDAPAQGETEKGGG